MPVCCHQTLEAEADKETEELAVAAKAKRRYDNRAASRRQQKQQQQSQQVEGVAGVPGDSAQQLIDRQLDHTEQQAGQHKKGDAVPTEPKASCSAGLSVEPAAGADIARDAAVADTAGDAQTAVAAKASAAAEAEAEAEALPNDSVVRAAAPAVLTAAELDPAEAAALPVDVSKLLLSGRTVGASRWQAIVASDRPRLAIPAAFRGPDSGPGAAAGAALGGFDPCWSISKELNAKQQRSAKRKRDSIGSRNKQDADVEAEGGGLETPTAAATSGQAQQPPAGKPLAAGSRPAWCQQVDAGTAHLNKRRHLSWEDDLDQPQEVEFMLGCSKCSFQRVR
jgi:hypothetical protein